jgi:hypothetical protein
LLFAKRAGAKYGIPARDILVELGRKKLVGGDPAEVEDAAALLNRRDAFLLPAKDLCEQGCGLGVLGQSDAIEKRSALASRLRIPAHLGSIERHLP